MVCTSCKTSYNVLRHSYVENSALRGVEGLVVDIPGGGDNAKERVSIF